MKADILNLEGVKQKSIELPPQFNQEIRPDIIKKAFLYIRNLNRALYGAKPTAGMRSSAKLSRRRRAYKTAYGHGISRVPRKTLWQRGRQFGWVGAFAPGTRGGRRAHPPKSSKILITKINKKENRKAITSAISASINKELLKRNGFTFDKVPIIIETKIEEINKTKDIIKILEKFELKNDLFKGRIKKIRHGKGKLRGRKYRKSVGILIVTSKDCPLLNIAKNLGFESCKVDNLNAELLAPGSNPGRLIIWSQESVERLDKEKLFLLEKPKVSFKKQKNVELKQQEKPKKQKSQIKVIKTEKKE